MTDNYTTEKTIENFSNGDKMAFDIIFRRYRTPLVYFAQQLIHNKEEAEDTVSETFIKLWKLHKNFHTEANVKAFLYITTRNHCLNYLGWVQRKKTFLTDSDEIFEEDIRVWDCMLESGIIDEIYAEIEKLPEQTRKVFKMSLFDGLKTDEIAERLNIKKGTVYNLKKYALDKLKSEFINKKSIVAVIILLWLESGEITLSKKSFTPFVDFNTPICFYYNQDQIN